MRFAAIIRERESDHGAFGRLYLDDGWSCFTAELPWSWNERNYSCIPNGVYECDFMPRSASGKYRNVYHVKDVPFRGGILIHAGNFAGDRRKGYRTDSYGCILLALGPLLLGQQDGSAAGCTCVGMVFNDRFKRGKIAGLG